MYSVTPQHRTYRIRETDANVLLLHSYLHWSFGSGLNVALREALSSSHFFYCPDISSRPLMCSSRLIVLARAAFRRSKHHSVVCVTLWQNLKVLVSRSHNWVSMANHSLNFIAFPLGQSGGTVRQPNYNPRWGGRPWVRGSYETQLSHPRETFTGTWCQC